MMSCKSHCALLTNSGGLTSFSYGGRTIRFRTPDNLVRYTSIKEWDNGYLVVDADYEGFDESVEEYIDLCPILENLYMDTAAFLQPIQEVCLANDSV